MNDSVILEEYHQKRNAFMLLIRDSLCTYYKNNIIHGEDRTPFKTVNKKKHHQAMPNAQRPSIASQAAA